MYHQAPAIRRGRDFIDEQIVDAIADAIREGEV